jgi:hypothetical protein
MPAPNDALSAETQPRRQPRIFAIPAVVPMSTAKVEPAAEPKRMRRKATTTRETPEVPVSQFGPSPRLDKLRDDARAGGRALWGHCRRDREDYQAPQLTSQILA